MAHQIHIQNRVVDGDASSLISTLHANSTAGKKVTDVAIIDAYTIDFDVSIQKLPTEGPGLQVFKNAAQYFAK